MWKHVRNITLILIVLALVVAYYMTRPDVAKLPIDAVTGPSPQITEGRPQIFQTIKVADLISNTSSIVRHDPKFAVVYLDEARQLLDVLTRADPRLLAMAREQIGA